MKIRRFLKRPLPFSMALICGMLASAPVTAQVVEKWATILDDEGRLDEARFVVIDPAGNVIVAGISTTTVEDMEVRLAKLDPSGALIWVRRFAPGGGGRFEPVGLATDQAGNILVAGNHLLGPGSSRTVTMKVRPDGTEAWRAIYDNPGAFDDGAGIESDDRGGAIVAGRTAPTTRTFSMVKFFIVAYDSDGRLTWQDTYDNGRDQEWLYDIVRDPLSGAVFLAGGVTGKNGGPLLLRYDADGRRRWAKRYAAQAGRPAIAERVAVGPDGNVVMAGLTTGVLGFLDIQVSKVEATSGKKLWSAVYGSGNGDPSLEDRVIDLATDGIGNVFVAGRVLGAEGSGDALLLKYSSDGVLSWASIDDRIDVSAEHFAVDASGNSYLTGAREFFDEPYFTNVWLTTRYDSGGNIVWTVEYDGNSPLFNYGVSHDLALAPGGDVIVTGFENGDTHTVRYQQP